MTNIRSASFPSWKPYEECVVVEPVSNGIQISQAVIPETYAILETNYACTNSIYILIVHMLGVDCNS